MHSCISFTLQPIANLSGAAWTAVCVSGHDVLVQCAAFADQVVETVEHVHVVGKRVDFSEGSETRS